MSAGRGKWARRIFFQCIGQGFCLYQTMDWCFETVFVPKNSPLQLIQIAAVWFPSRKSAQFALLGDIRWRKTPTCRAVLVKRLSNNRTYAFTIGDVAAFVKITFVLLKRNVFGTIHVKKSQKNHRARAKQRRRARPKFFGCQSHTDWWCQKCILFARKAEPSGSTGSSALFRRNCEKAPNRENSQNHFSQSKYGSCGISSPSIVRSGQFLSSLRLFGWAAFLRKTRKLGKCGARGTGTELSKNLKTWYSVELRSFYLPLKFWTPNANNQRAIRFHLKGLVDVPPFNPNFNPSFTSNTS